MLAPTKIKSRSAAFKVRDKYTITFWDVTDVGRFQTNSFSNKRDATCSIKAKLTFCNFNRRLRRVTTMSTFCAFETQSAAVNSVELIFAFVIFLVIIRKVEKKTLQLDKQRGNR